MIGVGAVLLFAGIIIGLQFENGKWGGPRGAWMGDDMASTTDQTMNGQKPGVTGAKPSGSKPAGGTATIPTVRYTDNGFVPSILEIKAGQAVRFVNESSRTMWVKTIQKDSPWVALNQGTSVGKGGSWTFTFTTLGTWGYQNDNYKEHTGAVAVMPQR